MPIALITPPSSTYSSLAHKHTPCIQLYIWYYHKILKLMFKKFRKKTKSINFSPGNDSTVDFSIHPLMKHRDLELRFSYLLFE